MNKIYFDNSSTSFPKALKLGEVVGKFIDNNGININRGLYTDSFSVVGTVIETRKLLARLFNCECYKNIIFTSGITQSINLCVLGLVSQGDEIITSNMEHNAVVRTLHYNKKIDKVHILDVNKESKYYLNELEALINSKTKFVIINHESNVNGNLVDIHSIGKICAKHNVYFVVDSAQSAGKINIDMQKDCIDILCFTGHKGLYGPQGIGGFALSKRIENILEPVNVGGSGIKSDELEMPNVLPERFEAGTLNLPGIVGLNHALKFVCDITPNELNKQCEELGKYFLDKVQAIKNINIYLPINDNRNLSVISLGFTNVDNAYATAMLDNKYNIMVRCGMHCAYQAHQTIGSYPAGTIRFSFGYFNTRDEVDIAIKALSEIALQ